MVYQSAEDLHRDISATLQKLKAGDPTLQRITNRIRDGTATGEDAHAYSARLGELASQAIEAHVSPETTPDFGWDMSRGSVKPVLVNNFYEVTDRASEVQAIEDRKSGIGMKAVRPELPEGRIDALVDAAGDYSSTWEHTVALLRGGVVNLTQSFYDSFVEKNAEARHRAGLEATIVRKVAGKACAWCMNLAGTYKYPEQVPKDVYRRHDNCRCYVTFKSGKTRQNVWSKETWQSDRETMEARRNTGLSDGREPAKIEARKKIGSLPKTLQLADEVVGRSVGAKAKNYDILNLATGERYHLVEGSSLTDVQVFAGKGTKTVFRNAEKYAERYGGAVGEWQHVKGHGLLATPDGDRAAELHWVQCAGIGKKEMFVKEWLDES